MNSKHRCLVLALFLCVAWLSIAQYHLGSADAAPSFAAVSSPWWQSSSPAPSPTSTRPLLDPAYMEEHPFLSAIFLLAHAFSADDEPPSPSVTMPVYPPSRTN